MDAAPTQYAVYFRTVRSIHEASSRIATSPPASPLVRSLSPPQRARGARTGQSNGLAALAPQRPRGAGRAVRTPCAPPSPTAPYRPPPPPPPTHTLPSSGEERGRGTRKPYTRTHTTHTRGGLLPGGLVHTHEVPGEPRGARGASEPGEPHTARGASHGKGSLTAGSLLSPKSRP